MNYARIRNWVIATMACACSFAGAAELQVGLTPVKPAVESTRWIVNADAQSAEVGISRYILRPGSGKHEMNILVMGDSDRMAYVNLDRANDVSSMRITMFASGEQLDIFSSRHSIEVGLNSMIVLSVNIDDGEILGSMGPVHDSAAGDVMYALTHDQNLRAHLANYNSEPSLGYGCDHACRIEYPQLDDCNGPLDELACCSREAYYDHCRRACQCDIDYEEWWQAPARWECKKFANTLLIYEGLGCGAGFLWPL